MQERKKQLSRISKLRERAVLAFASALTKQAPIAIEYDDRIPIFDQLNDIQGDKIDVILETPGGSAEIVEDIVLQIRNKFSEVGMIVPGYAKSAGTIMVMAGDEILMEPSSALGPIDAQIIQGGKRFSAHAFIEGLEKIKNEIENTGKLNRAYIPILQNISPGEIQNIQNALDFAKILVTDWLSKYKFKFWDKHSSTGLQVTEEHKKQRANEIAEKLINHSLWLTHGRSITIKDLEDMRLKIIDYSTNSELCDAIRRYYILLKMTFDTTNIYKIYETPTSQIYRFVLPEIIPTEKIPIIQTPDKGIIELECPNCKSKLKIQTNFKPDIPLENGVLPFPKDNKLVCPICKASHNLSGVRGQIESQLKKKIL